MLKPSLNICLFPGEQRELAAKNQKVQQSNQKNQNDEPRIAPRIQPRASVQKKEVTISKPEVTKRLETMKIVEPEIVEDEVEESLEESSVDLQNDQTSAENEIKQFENDDDEKSGLN